MRIAFFGTPHFAAETLEYLLQHGVNIVAVVTKPDKAQGRSGALQPTPVKQVALAHGLPMYQPPKCSHPDFAPVLQGYNADLFVVVAYGEIIKEHLLSMPRLGCVNVHASLLPKYRGAAPIQRAIMNGETETGVSIMYMVKELDAGDVIRADVLPIGPDTTTGELRDQLCKVGCKALLEVIHTLEKGPVARKPQDSSKVTFAAKVELEDFRINWNQSAQVVHNLVRAANPEPGAWCQADVRGEPKRLKIWRTKVNPNSSGAPGQVHFNGKTPPIVTCSEGSLALIEVQLEGKKSMPGQDLFRGLNVSSLQ